MAWSCWPGRSATSGHSASGTLDHCYLMYAPLAGVAFAGGGPGLSPGP